MLKNYIKIALRTLLKHPGYSFINIFGLSLGIASMLLIALFSINELTYDQFHENSDQIHQVYKQRITPNGIQDAMDLWSPLKTELTDTYPGIEKAARFWAGTVWVEVDEYAFEEQVTYTDQEFFEMFSFPLLYGNSSKPFENLSSVVVSKEIASRFFPGENPIGKVISIGFETDYIVTGVMDDIPVNSTLQPQIVVQLESDPEYASYESSWGGSFLDMYVLLGENASPELIESQFPDLITKIWDEEENQRTNFRLLALPEIHNYNTNSNQVVYILIGIALAIIAIAIINFVNLATARSIERGKEVGVRKSLGASRGQLIKQFLGESIAISFFAFLTSIILVEVTLPFFNQFINLELDSLWGISFTFLVALVVSTAFIGVIAGLIPAILLSKFNPSHILKGALDDTKKGFTFRKVLVSTQFGITTFILFGTMVIWSQLQHMKTTDPGFDRTGIVAIETNPRDFTDSETAVTRIATFRNELTQIAGVNAISSSVGVPGQWRNSFMFARPEGWDEDRARVRFTYIDHQFFDTYNVQFQEGSNFANTADSVQYEYVIINEAARKDFGWNEGLEKQIQVGREEFVRVIGVVDNYNYASLVNEVEPIVHFYRSPENLTHNVVSVKISSPDIASMLSQIQDTWSTYFPTREMSYFFIDENFEMLYQNQDRLARVSGIFTLLIIIISCLGLFALTSLIVIKKSKEIGIRKVLGANVFSIVQLLSIGFLKLVGIGFLLASPLAWLFMSTWLNNFAFRIDLSGGYLIISGVVLLILTLFTTSFYATKAATANPVDSLKTE